MEFAKSNQEYFTLLKGIWRGNWGSGELSIKFTSPTTGKVFIPGHSNGTCKLRMESNLIVCDISRDDGLIQGFICSFVSPSRMEGQYVHWNCSAFTQMYLNREEED